MKVKARRKKNNLFDGNELNDDQGYGVMFLWRENVKSHFEWILMTIFEETTIKHRGKVNLETNSLVGSSDCTI